VYGGGMPSGIFVSRQGECIRLYLCVAIYNPEKLPNGAILFWKGLRAKDCKMPLQALSRGMPAWMDAGSRATQEQLPRGLGEGTLNKCNFLISI